MTAHATQHEKTLDGLRCERIGKGFYHCFSETHSGTVYIVDLMDNLGHGEFNSIPLGACTCRDFGTRRLPRFNGCGIPMDIFRCKHIRRVRCYAMDLILANEIQKEQKTNKRQR